jgi:hypothetical protein
MAFKVFLGTIEFLFLDIWILQLSSKHCGSKVEKCRCPRPTDRRRRSADILDLALRFQGRKRVHSVDELKSAIVAKRPVGHLERSGFTASRLPFFGEHANLTMICQGVYAY